MIRVDSYPTHIVENIKIRIGKALPFGASIVPDGVNFSVFSRYATACDLVLYHKGEKEPYAIIPFPDEFRIGNVFSMIVFDVDYENIEYGYRMDGPNQFSEGFLFDRNKILLDPYAKSIGGRNIWGVEPDWDCNFQYRGRIIYDDFDWEGDKPLEIKMEDLIIYELHVRSFTKHGSSNVKYPGTYASLVEKIPYLKKLGVNCVELLPIFEFDEFDNAKISNATGKRLLNYWGYSTVGFFAPKAGYAATGKFGMESDEFKTLVRELHKNGIEVILDVVFNHTAEGNEKGPYISYRGIDNKTYYLLTEQGYYYNFSGCGNTLNCNNPVVRAHIVDCLRYWVSEYHIDGFRFDLASILSRDSYGVPMSNPPLLESLAYDSVLGTCKLIAEAWDAGGLYQVGNFPSWGRWAEWNGRYRDAIRKFLIGQGNVAAEIIQRIQGSQDMYGTRSSNASINFITCHDGFTAMDMTSYNDKHNWANEEGNGDGSNDNFSWNCGHEGETEDPDIRFLRKKQIKNAMTMLMFSRGIPMLLSGDEFGNHQSGNNNAYCQDNEVSWINWSELNKNEDLFVFVQKLIAFRKNHPVLRNPSYHMGHNKTGHPEVSWHGQKAWNVGDLSDNLTLAIMYVECCKKYPVSHDTYIYMAMNMHWEMHGFELPLLPNGKRWFFVINTDNESFNDICDEREEIEIENQREVLLSPRSILVAVGK